jgi:hypothetical protein
MKLSCLHQREPCLNIFTGGTGIITRWQKIFVYGMLATNRSCTLIMSLQIRRMGNVSGFFDHRSSLTKRLRGFVIDF